MPDYFYDMDLVVDPLNPSNVVAKGQVAIYDPADTAGTTLLALKDPSGLPLPNPLTSTANGFLPPRIATIPQTMWKSGGFTGYFNSFKGLRDEAVAAVAEAEAAAATAGAAATADLAARIAAGQFVGAPGQDGSNVLPTDTAIRNVINDAPAPEATGTDDTTALQAAINAAAAAGKALVLKPNATYLISNTLTVPSNATIDGRGATIKAKAGTNKPVLTNADATNGNTNITLRDLKLDGNGVNQTIQFTVAVMTRVTYSRFENLDVQGGMRNQGFPNGTFGEGFSLVLSDNNEVIGGRFHDNTYDGLKLRTSNFNRISNVLCDNNGRAGIQISFYSPTGPPYNVGENVESAGSNDNVFSNIVCKHATGTNHFAAPNTSGIYIHTGYRNIVTNFTIEGFQQGIGLFAGVSDNKFSNGLVKHRASGMNLAGLDLHNGTENRNIFTNVRVVGMAGADGKLARVTFVDSGNQFIACNFSKGAGTGTWTVENNGDNTRFLDCVSDVTIPTGGTGTIVRDPGAVAAAAAPSSRTDSFSGATGAVPYGWATRWAQAGAAWTEDAAGYLRLVKTGSGRAVLANVVAGDGKDVEILAKVKTAPRIDASTPIGLVVRGSGAAGAENGYYLALGTASGAGELYIQKYAAGVSSSIGGVNTLAWTADTWYWLRFKVSTQGTNVQLSGKIWADGGAEPAAYQLSNYTDSSASRIQTSGFHGVFGFTTGTTSDVDSYTVTITN